MKRKEHSDYTLGQIRGMSVAGWSHTQISKNLEIPRESVTSILKRVKNLRDLPPRPPSPRGRKPILSSRHERKILRNMEKDSFQTLSDMTPLPSESSSSHLPSISGRTVRRTLSRNKVNSRIAAVKPYLTEKHRKARLAWAKAHAHWTHEQWSKVVFSDETNFDHGKPPKRQRVWRHSNERFLPKKTKPSFASMRKTVGFWGCFSSAGCGPSYILPPGIMMRSNLYKTLLETEVAPHIASLRNETPGDYIYQHDNARYHTSKMVKDAAAREGVTILDWPSQSPDLNPIENLWAQMKTAVGKMGNRLAKREKMESFVLAEWGRIAQGKIDSLIGSMPNRCAEVIKNRGGATKY